MNSVNPLHSKNLSVSYPQKKTSSDLTFLDKKILTKEEFDSFIREIDIQTKKIIAENEIAFNRTKLLDARVNKKMKKVLTEAIEALIEQGQAVPAKLINALRSLK